MRVRDFAEYVDSLYVKIYGTIPNDQLQDNGDIPLAIPHEEIRMSVFMDGLNPSIKTILWQNLKPSDTFRDHVTKAADIEKMLERKDAVDSKYDALKRRTGE